MDKIVSRADARRNGLAKYFNGTPCKRGHIAERYTNNATCVECHRICIRASYPESKKRVQEWKSKNRARVNEQAKRSYLLRRDHRIERSRIANKRRYEENTEYWRQKSREWRARNPEKTLAQVRNRKSRLRAAEGRHTGEDIKRIFDAQKGKCALPGCRVSIKRAYHVDHIIPLIKGGSHWPNNLQLTCARCNQTKYDKDQIDFVRERGFLI